MKYSDIQAVNQSTLKEMRKSPRHYQWACNNQKPQTDAMAFGSLVHCLILEGNEVTHNRYWVVNFDLRPDERTMACKVNKEWLAEQMSKAESINKKVVTYEQMDEAHLLRQAVLDHPEAAELIFAKGDCEKTVEWQDWETELQCKGILDKHIPDQQLFIDLKTVRSLYPDDLQRDINKWDWPFQCAYYMDAVGATHAKMILVENTAPFAVTVKPVAERAIDLGRSKYKFFLKNVKECRAEYGHEKDPESKPWPGIEKYGYDLAEIDYSEWHYNKITY